MSDSDSVSSNSDVSEGSEHHDDFGINNDNEATVHIDLEFDVEPEIIEHIENALDE